MPTPSCVPRRTTLTRRVVSMAPPAPLDNAANGLSPRMRRMLHCAFHHVTNSRHAAGQGRRRAMPPARRPESLQAFRSSRPPGGVQLVAAPVSHVRPGRTGGDALAHEPRAVHRARLTRFIASMHRSAGTQRAQILGHTPAAQGDHTPCRRYGFWTMRDDHSRQRQRPDSLVDDALSVDV